MLGHNEIDVDVVDADLVGFESNITGAGPWVPTVQAPTDGLAHRVSLRNDSATDYSGQDFTLVGTDENSNPISDVIQGPAGSATVESVLYFKTLTSITASGAGIGADTFDIGWVDEVATKMVALDFGQSVAPTISVDITGTINFTVQETFKNVMGGDAPVWIDVTALATKTSDTVAQISVHATAVRLTVNSYSSGAELQMSIVQSREVIA